MAIIVGDGWWRRWWWWWSWKQRSLFILPVSWNEAGIHNLDVSIFRGPHQIHPYCLKWGTVFVLKNSSLLKLTKYQDSVVQQPELEAFFWWWHPQFQERNHETTRVDPTLRQEIENPHAKDAGPEWIAENARADYSIHTELYVLPEKHEEEQH